MSKCHWPKCHSSDEIAVIYYGKNICEKCWVKHSEMETERFKGVLGVKDNEPVVKGGNNEEQR